MCRLNMKLPVWVVSITFFVYFSALKHYCIFINIIYDIQAILIKNVEPWTLMKLLLFNRRWRSGASCSCWTASTWSRWTSCMMTRSPWTSVSTWAGGSRASTGKTGNWSDSSLLISTLHLFYIFFSLICLFFENKVKDYKKPHLKFA